MESTDEPATEQRTGAEARDGVAAAASSPTLTVSDVTKRYGSTIAVDDVTLSFDAGTFHGLLGPNGSGKTTLFMLLAGLVRPTSGRIDHDSVRVGYSFQEPRFYPTLTVRENLEIFRGFAADPPPKSWIDTLLDGLRLDPAAHRRGDELSGGFRTKLDLGLALVTQPQYLLLDEPLADVDDYSRRRIREFLASYQQQADRTVVVSTHNVEAFAELFNRVTIIVDGSLRYDGPPEDDVVAQYRDRLG